MHPPTPGVAANEHGAGGSGRMDEIVRRAQGGDVDAFEIVYRAQAPSIRALCLRMSRDEREANELVQDVFVRVWERLPSFRAQSALPTWMHRLAVNVVLERWRSAKRAAMRLIDNPEDAAFDAPEPALDLDARMDLDAATARLPAGARVVFVLHDVEGYSHEEISAMSGIAAGTSRTQLFRARRALARMLAL